MHVAVNTSSLPDYKKYRVSSRKNRSYSSTKTTPNALWFDLSDVLNGPESNQQKIACSSSFKMASKRKRAAKFRLKMAFEHNLRLF